MTQLVKQQSAVAISGNPFVCALAAKPVKNSSDFEIAEAISSSIEKAAFDLGLRQMSDDDLNLLKFGLLNEVKNSFTTLTIEEIKNAFHYGSRGKYGEVYGLNVIQAAKWMSSYMTDQSRVEARKELAKANEEKKEPTADEKFTTAKELCLSAFEQVKNNKTVGLNAGAVYIFLNSLELIHADYKKGIYKEAMTALVEQYKKDISFSTDLLKRRQLNAKLELLTQNIEADGITKEQHDEVLRAGKRIVLTNWLRDLLIDETDLNELIEGKRLYYKTISKV